MKSKHLLLTLLMALLVPWAANAQTLGDYTFSTGTDATKWKTLTTTTSLLVNGGDSQASSVLNIGFAFPFGEETYTKFSVNTDGNLRLGNTATGTNLYSTPFSSSNANQNNPKINAFGCDGYATANNYVKYQTFDNNLLVVEFCMNTYSQRSNTALLFKWQIQLHSNGDIEIVFPDESELPTTNPSVAHQCGMCVNSTDGWVIKLSDNTAEHFTAGSSTTNATGTWFDANRYYRFEAPVIACPKPGGLTASNITNHNAVLDWISDADSWNLKYKEASETDYTEISVATKPFTLEPLTAGATYEYYVQGVCGGTPGEYSTNSCTFTIMCNDMTVPATGWTEDFEDYTFTSNSGTTNNLPDCWNFTNTTSYSSYKGYPNIYYGTSYGYNASAYSLKFYAYYYSSYDPQDQYAILPPVEDLTSLRLTFWARRYSDSYDATFSVGVMTDPSDASTFQSMATFSPSSITYEKCVVDFNTYTGTGNLIAIKMEKPTTSYRGVHIDEISLGDIPSCIEPSGLAVSNETPHGATFAWTAGAATQTAWHLYFSKTNVAPADDIDLSEVTAVSTNPYTLATGLDAETNYYVWVRANCGTNDYSVWVGPETFTTEVACPAPTNLTVPTNSITANEATASWAGTSESYVVMIGEEQIGQGTVDFEDQVIPAFFTNDATRPWTVTTGGADESSYCIIPGNKGVNSSQSNLTCEVTGPCTVSFKAKISSESGYDKGYFLIDGTEKFNISGTQDWTAYSYELTEGTHTLVWRYYKDSSAASGSDLFYVDNISMPMHVVNSWTEYTTTETNYPFEGLTPNTAYQVKVKGNCGDEGYSQETAPVSFTTLPSCFAPTGLAIAEGYPTAHAVRFTWDYEEGEIFQYALVPGSHVNVQDVDDSYFNSPDWHAGEDFPFWNTLNADQEQSFFLRKKCGNTDFSEIVYIYVHTLVACPAPTNFAVAGLTGHTATLEWEGTSASYEVSYGAANTPGTLLSTGFEDNAIPTAFTNDATYPWTVTAGGANNSGYCAIPGNSGVNSSSSNLTYVTTGPGSVTFMAKVSSESGYDYGRFFIDGAQKMQISGTNDWTEYSYELTEGTHTLVWRYYKDTSTASGNDLFYVDDIVVTGLTVGEWITATTTEETITLQGLTPETPYQAYLRGNCDSEGYSTGVGPISFTTDVACPAPTGFALEQLKSDHVVLNWNAGADAWQIQINDNTVYTDIALEDVTINEGVATYTLNGLTENTPYTLKLRANCTSSNDGYSEWTSPLSFTTLENCPTPTDVEVTNIGHYSATVSWEGDSEYTLKVGEEADPTILHAFGFEDGVIPTSFTNTSNYPWEVIETDASEGTHSMRSTNQAVGNSESTISVTVNYTADGFISFDAKCMGEGTSTLYDKCIFYIDGTAKFTKGANDNQWDAYKFNVSAGEHTFMWSYTKDSSVNPTGDAFTVDNIVMGLTNVTWRPYIEGLTENTYGLTELTPGTQYFVQVQANCGENPVSSLVSFTTVSPNVKYFITEGDWGTAANWEPENAPTIDQTVELRANVTITGEATAKTIDQSTYAITIEDGGKLKANNSVYATVKKNIEPWTVDTDIENETLSNGWYLITNPITSNFAPTAENGFLVYDYDFYQFDFTMDPEEWRNREAGAFTNMNSSAYTSYGYLYANSQATTLTYSGNIKAANSALYKTAEAPTTQYRFSGWYLLGNGFMCDAYVATANTGGNALPFYKMNDDRNGFEAVAATSLTALAPMEGFFYQNSGTSSQTVYITTTAPEVQRGGQLNMNLRSSNKQLDNAILVFGGEQKLGKFSFREGSSKIYMPVEGKDLAISTAEGKVGEQPVSFKAEKNGTYSLSFTSQEVSFSYLHLIDNMTGADVNLLETPSYSFEAKTTDYANRFRLVFATGSSIEGENFGFVNAAGNLCIFGIEGEATVQVVDVMGHVLSSETFSGSYEKSINAAPGVYMIRLINGNDVKVQKIVVR